MGYSVKDRAELCGTFRWIEIQRMEMLARWIPTTPEMEVKVLFGRHVWDCASHADALGRRAFELRAPLHYTRPASPMLEELLREAAQLPATSDRVSVFYEVLGPALGDRYRIYIESTDTLMDEPTVRILENALRDHERMDSDRRRLAPQTSSARSIRPDEWRQRERSIASVVTPSEALAATRQAGSPG